VPDRAAAAPCGPDAPAGARRAAPGTAPDGSPTWCASANARQRPTTGPSPGTGESDLITGADGAWQVLTLVERTTGFLILQRIPYDRTAGRVALKLA
jgi:hypothetical protein